MNNIQNILIFSNHKDFSLKVKERLSAHKLKFNHCSDLKVAFDLISTEPFDVLIFETYGQLNEIFYGINEQDLDVLLYFCASDKSQNRHMRFLPIDKDKNEVKANKAGDIYEAFYENHLLLLPAVYMEDLQLESLFIDEGRKMLFELVGTLDSACDHLDGELIRIKGQEENLAKEINGISGKIGEDESFSRVTGKNEEDESFSRVTGKTEEDESFTRVTGKTEEDESFSRVTGKHEEDNFTTRVAEDKTNDQGENAITRIKGEKQNRPQDDITRISAEGNGKFSSTSSVSIEAQNSSIGKEFNSVIKGEAQEASNQLHHIKGSVPPVQETEAITIKGDHDSDQKSEVMKVKHLNPKENSKEDNEEHKEEHHDINARNDHGQTPLMLFCLKGEKDKAMDLIKSGAKTSLKCKRGLTVLHYACTHPDNLEVVEYLVEVDKLRLSTRDSDGLDSLAMAIKKDCPDTVKWLVANGARTTSKINGQPLLHFAAAHNSFQSFLILLSLGLPLVQKCNQGLSLEEFCKKKRKLPFLKALKAYTLLNAKKESA